MSTYSKCLLSPDALKGLHRGQTLPDTRPRRQHAARQRVQRTEPPCCSAFPRHKTTGDASTSPGVRVEVCLAESAALQTLQGRLHPEHSSLMQPKLRFAKLHVQLPIQVNQVEMYQRRPANAEAQRAARERRSRWGAAPACVEAEAEAEAAAATSRQAQTIRRLLRPRRRRPRPAGSRC